MQIFHGVSGGDRDDLGGEGVSEGGERDGLAFTQTLNADYTDRDPHSNRVDTPIARRTPPRPELSCSKGELGQSPEQSVRQGRESERDDDVAKRK
ncbi:hypothetical protein Bca101_009823 [Brassica carinata]